MGTIEGQGQAQSMWGRFFGGSETTEVEKPSVAGSGAISLTVNQPVESKGTFNVQSDIRIVTPWRGSVAAGSTLMYLTIDKGSAAFGRLSEGKSVEQLSDRFTIFQHGDSRAAPRTIGVVSKGEQVFTQTLKQSGRVEAEAGSKTGSEVTIGLHIEGRDEPLTHTFNTMTRDSDTGVKPGRARHLSLAPFVGKEGVEATMEDFVDTTCKDRAGDCATGCWEGTSKSVRFVGSTLYKAGDTIWQTGRHPVLTAQSLRDRTIRFLGGEVKSAATPTDADAKATDAGAKATGAGDATLMDGAEIVDTEPKSPVEAKGEEKKDK
ncbi:MAG: hypothetical protein S4CHLAM6_13600 [Chlamydiae bacterium]|nr:hypothetical protein [Chlamydiota bacterium]